MYLSLPRKILGQTYEKLRIRSDLGTSEENFTLNLRKTFDQCSIRSFGSTNYPLHPQIFPATLLRKLPVTISADSHIRILPPACKTCRDGLPDTSALRHFGIKTVRHQYIMIFTGAELSGHFGTSAEIPRDTSAPSVKNTHGLLFRQNRPTLSTICRDSPMLQLVRL